MGSSSRQRRDARRRATGPRSAAGDVGTLIDVARRFAVDAPGALGPRVSQLNELSAAAPGGEADPVKLVIGDVLAGITRAWEQGWQPLDLVHAVHRRASKAAARWITCALLVEAQHSGARGRAPQAWVEQLDALASRGRADDELLPRGGLASVAQWTVALVVLDFMRRLPPSQLLMPPPSRWGHGDGAAQPRRADPSSVPLTQQRAKTLTKIRALLAKAESTDFVAEADALTAKAQDLMTRHAIDEALLADEAGQSVDVGSVRVLIHHPYAVEKATLLDVIGRANRCRAVWSDYASYATLVGVPTDLAQVEMLFTSTLVQATRAMTQAGEESHGLDRSTSFRKAFLVAYAHRIGQRLAESSHEAAATYGTDLVPVFQRQEAAIAGEFDRLFPQVTSGGRRSSFDARGWHAGTAAADAAVLPAGAVES
ncbi:DUF2786 domain-containing protein [Aeromicrobium wangtongii]|uniref:DUF2786 domain-containing protein n=1 Tax=Aeromicrobium wangtongii TaxID=2969247 RepID=UPI002016EE73|nr:DUF2786 domain-containing protein [Aeromicrobium wangtongii]MCL3819469.1 DUF2786 domain-containing protein [Aeromicrobium wangtongii]